MVNKSLTSSSHWLHKIIVRNIRASSVFSSVIIEASLVEQNLLNAIHFIYPDPSQTLNAVDLKL